MDTVATSTCIDIYVDDIEVATKTILYTSMLEYTVHINYPYPGVAEIIICNPYIEEENKTEHHIPDYVFARHREPDIEYSENTIILKKCRDKTMEQNTYCIETNDPLEQTYILLALIGIPLDQALKIKYESDKKYLEKLVKTYTEIMRKPPKTPHRKIKPII